MSYPVLANGLTVKQERFAQLVADGANLSDAYRQAYDASNMLPATVNSRAYDLTQNSEVADRIAALQHEAAEAAKFTRSWAISRLMQNAKDAAEAQRWAPSNRAVELLGREHGMFQDQRPGASVQVDIIALQLLSERTPGEAIGPQARALRVAGEAVTERALGDGDGDEG